MKAVLLAIVLAACGGSQPPTPPVVSNRVPTPPVDAAVDAAPAGSAVMIAKMNEFTDELCSCTDPACAERVAEEMTRWSRELAKSNDRAEELSEPEVKRMAETAERMAKCMTALYTPGAGAGSAP